MVIKMTGFEDFKHRPDKQRFEVLIDDQVAGFAHYRVHQPSDSARSVWVFDSAEVDPKFRGRGVASALLKATFDEVRGHNVKVRPTCPFVVAWFDSNPDYQDLLDTD